MNSDSRIFHNRTSTPKRRKLDTGKLYKKNQDNFNIIDNGCPINFTSPCNVTNAPERCESPHLPCNQVEYSESNNISCSDIPCSLDINSSVLRGIENWESFVVSNKTNKLCNNELSKMVAIEETDEISDDMFYSKLEQSNHVNDESETEKEFKERVEQSFSAINQSLCQITEPKTCNKSFLFESKDSFLLDIKENAINETRTKEFVEPDTLVKAVPKNEGFYGLPMVAKGLFKTYRKIDKFYDWQEECLNLDAIKERRNLIYALPTSGGKTLVAEVLMLREVIVRKKNALFILPFVAIVQEKIGSLSPFALQLNFLVEEYAAGKGHIPPKKRRKKNSIYIGTIEKGLALVRSLIELDRLHEIGLIVVDELHLIGEKDRGATLETLLSTVIFTHHDIQIVGMSATIGNLPEVATFLKAEVFQRQFRPVALDEYVKLGDMLYKIQGGETIDLVPHRKLDYNYSAEAARLDPDRVAGLVAEVAPAGSVLVFCPTKRNCENVAALLCKLQTPEMSAHRAAERAALAAALRAEGACAAQCGAARRGVAFHHAGLAGDERALLEHAFRAGVVSVLCCTSTLAAGVNLPAARVVLRAPRVGAAPASAAAYRQMAGRAGRAGLAQSGESIVICSPQEWGALRATLAAGLAPARSALAQPAALVLGAVALRLAASRVRLRRLLACTLMAVTHTEPDGSPLDINALCDTTVHSLLRSGALEIVNAAAPRDRELGPAFDDDSVLAVSKLGRAAIKGCMDLSTAKQLLKDLETSSRSLVLIGSLHLLYLVTPHDAAGIKPDYRQYYSLYCSLNDEGVQTAKILGITEQNAIRMMIGKPITDDERSATQDFIIVYKILGVTATITSRRDAYHQAIDQLVSHFHLAKKNVPEKVICRFYLALMLHDLWKQRPFAEVAEKYCIARGTVQSVMTSAAAFASSAQKFCEELEHLWPFRALFAELALRLQHCAAPELQQLMELPAVKKTRALQLVRAGYKRIEDLAKASADSLVNSISHLSRTNADQLISSARMMLIEKVENLRAEAEDVMEELKL